eukprot:5484160-Alexandrium_andersonii.AAC.1
MASAVGQHSPVGVEAGPESVGGHAGLLLHSAQEAASRAQAALGPAILGRAASQARQACHMGLQVMRYAAPQRQSA